MVNTQKDDNKRKETQIDTLASAPSKDFFADNEALDQN